MWFLLFFIDTLSNRILCDSLVRNSSIQIKFTFNILVQAAIMNMNAISLFRRILLPSFLSLSHSQTEYFASIQNFPGSIEKKCTFKMQLKSVGFGLEMFILLNKMHTKTNTANHWKCIYKCMLHVQYTKWPQLFGVEWRDER